MSTLVGIQSAMSTPSDLIGQGGTTTRGDVTPGGTAQQMGTGAGGAGEGDSIRAVQAVLVAHRQQTVRTLVTNVTTTAGLRAARIRPQLALPCAISA